MAINRPRKKSSINWDWERAVQGLVSGGAYGFGAGGPKGAAVGAGIGLVAGGLSGRDTEADYAAYDRAIEEYGQTVRHDARLSANQLGADTGAALAARGLNASELAGGIVSANRGRIMRGAETSIAKFRAQIYAQIAEAERQAELADSEEKRRGWQNLAMQLGMQALMGDFTPTEAPTADGFDPGPIEVPEGTPRAPVTPNRDPMTPLTPGTGKVPHPDRSTMPPRDLPGYSPSLPDVPSITPPSVAPPATPKPTHPGMPRTPAPTPDITPRAPSAPRVPRQGNNVPRPKSPRMSHLEQAMTPEEIGILQMIFPDLEAILA